MDVSKTIFAVTTHTLECEEHRLKPRSERLGEPLWPWTVRGYPNEDWIRFPLVREFSDRFPELEMEVEVKQVEPDSDRITYLDLLIRSHAAVELKGPYEVKENFPPRLYNKILEDFKKQHKRATSKKAAIEPNLKHFVLLILHARKGIFYSGCFQELLEKLESDVQEQNSGICVRLQPSKPLVLNGQDPWLMEVCLYSVF